ncbi:MAG TPA: carotenoid oxygenase family protein [Ideonella sp.]|uniref:carotenoid oxygenase family protein n=1 Tax=Ideonella sp. TaxID=1929293 RepID=UPI002C74E34B|nr:carotenoid oxygenase family protein [Ideonella sp.]HSI49428.1 carotenoid oxygenase family protein [Ideonella sp.]
MALPQTQCDLKFSSSQMLAGTDDGIDGSSPTGDWNMSDISSEPRSIETLAPFRHSPEQHTAIPARVRGEVPSWLQGEVLRTCPVLFDTSGWHAQHWFDGLGMIYAFRIQPPAVDFRSRLLDSEAAREASLGTAELATFGTPSERALWRRVLKPVPRASDNANVNILKFGDDLVALTESDRQHLIDPETLASLGYLDYGNDALHGAMMTAHPHLDFERNRVVNLAVQFGRQVTVSAYAHGPASRKRDVIGTWRTNRVPYIHAFGLTPRHVILVAHPFAAAPLDMPFSNRAYIDHFQWRPEDGTRLVLIDRATGAVREHVTEAFFAFHTVNAYEHEGDTVLDLLAYPDADIVRELRVDHMLARLPELRPALTRIVMTPGVERARSEPLSSVGFEFPATNQRRVSGQAYRFAWGASNGAQPGGSYGSAIVKADLQRGETRTFSHDTHIFGEPLFVARPQGDGEDDGVLLSVGAAQDEASSMLAIIDAKTLALLASAEVPSLIPLGFHGSFQRSGG